MRIMVRSLRLLAAAFLLLTCPAPPSPARPTVAAWAGRYVFDGAAGRTVGGSPVTYHYELVIRPDASGPRAVLHLQGYQQDETILCGVRGDRRAIDVTFASYADGSTANAYGVKVYASGQALFRLSRAAGRRAPELLTTWLALHPASTGAIGVYFRHVGR